MTDRMRVSTICSIRTHMQIKKRPARKCTFFVTSALQGEHDAHYGTSAATCQGTPFLVLPDLACLGCPKCRRPTRGLSGYRFEPLRCAVLSHGAAMRLHNKAGGKAAK